MKNTNFYNENNQATYCPEDDKLRLYVGRVPREEYLALNAEGWTSTPKQDCDFVATWTVNRENTALSYAGIILDEDQSPQERAADRAERFGEYRDKRREEAHGYADRYDAGQTVHGYQDYAKAVRAADRHDRIADKACDSWSKAEYWQRRTAGVISHALYRSEPGVRFRRIKEIEADIRKAEKDEKEYEAIRCSWRVVSEIQDKEKQNKTALHLSGLGYDFTKYFHPRPESASSYVRENGTSLYGLLSQENDPITGKEAAEMYLKEHPYLGDSESRWLQHQRLRLSYEQQMLEAEGGRAGDLEMEVGGWVGKYQILKVNKSNATGRVVSVTVKAPLSTIYSFDKNGKAYGPDNPRPLVNTVLTVEDCGKDVYRAPTEEDREALKAKQASEPKKPKDPPLINPTREDAEKLQAIWNDAFSERCKNWYTPPIRSTIIEMTQEEYKKSSTAVYGKNGNIVFVGDDGKETYKQYCGNVKEGAVCRVRRWYEVNQAYRVIILTDKPQKPLPAFSPKAVEVKA